ncbi:copper chaperone PCu(A)C [Leucobacter chironomi]|uniref:copper chaperone PCu(A)C n=1 Tax=Leucobacter chironomi TaxID=491918 RepID=UPI0004258E58|nr:copper chaperone PCu(A)C [Leucobacter chironomi]
MTRLRSLTHSRAARTVAALSAAALLLAGCSTAAPASDGASADAPSAAFVDGWAKAGEQGGMTGVFGTLENHGDDDLVIASVESEAADSAELHEVTSAGVMQEITGDVTVPAGGSIEFVPGGDHIMLMGLTAELLAGEEVPITVTLADGSSVSFSVLVKAYSGANERYGEHGESGGTGEHDGMNDTGEHGEQDGHAGH